MTGRCGLHMADCTDPECRTHVGDLTDERCPTAKALSSVQRGEWEASEDSDPLSLALQQGCIQDPPVSE